MSNLAWVLICIVTVFVVAFLVLALVQPRRNRKKREVTTYQYPDGSRINLNKPVTSLPDTNYRSNVTNINSRRNHSSDDGASGNIAAVADSVDFSYGSSEDSSGGSSSSSYSSYDSGSSSSSYSSYDSGSSSSSWD